MDHLPQATLDFLSDLAANNEKEWFHANKKRYERELKQPTRAFVAALNDRMRSFAPELAKEVPHKAINRINRDIRFSKDKTPYNTHVWAGFGKVGTVKGASAGLYVGLSPESWAVGGGTWKAEKEQVVALRTQVAERHEELAELLSAAGVPEIFGPLTGDAYKRVPKPWTAEHPAADWLKLKSMHLRGTSAPEAITRPGFLDAVVERMERLVPVIRWMQAGLEG